MTGPAAFAHAVRAHLPLGPAFQPCACEASAAALFDRLRQLAPAVTIERLQNGRVIELARPLASVDARPV